MCGIGGWLSRHSENLPAAERMVQALYHRGPDAHGIQPWAEATLVHTRLSILDLSPSGAQPMSNEDGTVWTVFNGEIYNHHEIRQALTAQGHRFKGRSDTEILPHLYEECVKNLADTADSAGRNTAIGQLISQLRGMFALAIYDTRTRTLILARDRFGIKPLFYAPQTDRLAFASEIPALLALPGIDTQPNAQAIADFAALAYIPAPETFYTGIRALEPGELVVAQLTADGLERETQSYHAWEIPAPDGSGLSLNQAVEQTDALLAAGVQRQIESDVPLGAFLSGGIDSSLVSAAAQQALGGSLHTFNVQFAEEAYDETWAAKAVAEHIKTAHTTLDMGEVSGSWEHLTGLLLRAGQPFADTSVFAAHAICRLMRQHATVALSGDGGDEAFCGYELYWRIPRIARLQRLPAVAWYAAAAMSTPLVRYGLLPGHIPQRFQSMATADDTSIVQSFFCWVDEDEQQRLCRTSDLLPIRRLFEPRWAQPFSSRAERLLVHATEINTRLTLPNDFLCKVDTASMQESLEVRVPMLDEELFAFGLGLPFAMKVKEQECKYVLREVAKRRLPQAVASKPKHGFSLPVDAWVEPDFKVRLRQTLLGPSSTLPDFFQPDIYQPMIRAFCDGQPYFGVSRQGLYQRIIMLLAVHLALDRGSMQPTANAA